MPPLRTTLLLSLFLATASVMQAASPALAELASYEVGDPLAPQLAFEKRLRAAKSKERAATETELISLIAAPKTTTAAKRVFLHWLGWIGTKKSIPTLTEAAKNPDLAHAAVSALAALNIPKSDEALIGISRSIDSQESPGLSIPGFNQRRSDLDYLGYNYPEATRIESFNAIGQRRIFNLDDISNEFSASISALESAELESFGSSGVSPADFEGINIVSDTEFIAKVSPAEIRTMLAIIVNSLRRTPSEEIAPLRKIAVGAYAIMLTKTTHPVARIETAQALVTLDPVNPALFQFAADSDPRLRNVIACGMAVSGNRNALKILSSRFADIAPDTQARMMRTLATALATVSANPAALPLIERALASDNIDVHLAALAAAGSGGNQTTVAKLIPLLASEDKALSAAAFTALTQLPDYDGETNAAIRLTNVTQTIAPQILRILATRQDRDSFAAAMTAATSPDKTLRAAAYEAVALLVRADDLPAILSLDAAPNRREWSKALYAAAALHPEPAAVVTLLQKQLAAAKPADRPFLIAALTMVKSDNAKAALDAMLTSPDIDIRKETIRALSSARSETAFELLLARINAATDTSERLLAQRGAIDTIDQLTLPANDKIDAYRKLWQTADTQETKDAIIAAVKRIRGSAAARFLKEITPSKK